MPNSKHNLFALPDVFIKAMQRDPKCAWYKPLFSLLIANIIFMLLSSGFSLAWKGLGPSSSFVDAMTSGLYLQADIADSLQVFLAALNGVCMTAAAVVAVKVMGIGDFGSISSIERRLRWERIAKLAPSIFVFTAAVAIFFRVMVSAVEGDASKLANPNLAIINLFEILLLIPFQCVGEEYIFRGLALQAFGVWFSTIGAIFAQSMAFAFAHNYNLIGCGSVFASALMWGWLSARTGGIEVSICLHAANNVICMMLSVVYPYMAVSKNITIEQFFVNVAMSAMLASFAYYLCKQNGYLIED